MYGSYSLRHSETFEVLHKELVQVRCTIGTIHDYHCLSYGAVHPRILHPNGALNAVPVETQVYIGYIKLLKKKHIVFKCETQNAYKKYYVHCLVSLLENLRVV